MKMRAGETFWTRKPALAAASTASRSETLWREPCSQPARIAAEISAWPAASPSEPSMKLNRFVYPFRGPRRDGVMTGVV